MLTFSAILLGFGMVCGVLLWIYFDFRATMLANLARMEHLLAETKQDLKVNTERGASALETMAETVQLAGTPLDVVRDVSTLGMRIATLPLGTALDAVEKGMNLGRGGK